MQYTDEQNKAERINITLPASVLRRIDAAAKSAGESRSGYIACRALALEEKDRVPNGTHFPANPAQAGARGLFALI